MLDSQQQTKTLDFCGTLWFIFKYKQNAHLIQILIHISKSLNKPKLFVGNSNKGCCKNF